MAQLTIEQIANLANISRSTVSRVLNEHPSVRPDVRERVLRVISEHGYAPRAAARSLASRRTGVIGLLIPRSAAFIFADPFFALTIQGITEACAKEGYFLMLSAVTMEAEQGFYRNVLRSGHFDGVIMLSSDLDDPILPLLVRDKMPLVLIGNHPHFQDLHSVDADNRSGALQATKHLISLGHRRIATITGSRRMAAALDRQDGYERALTEAGLGVDARLLVEGDFTQQGGYRAMLQLLELPDPPTGVFVAGDTMAHGVLRALHERGYSVPDDIAIVSFDDLPAAAFANPPLTSVCQPITAMAGTAVKMLINQLGADGRSVSRACLPTELVIRDSCGAKARTSIEKERG